MIAIIEVLKDVTMDDVISGETITLHVGDEYKLHNVMFVNTDSDIEGVTCFDVGFTDYQGGYSVFPKDTFKLVAINTIRTD